MRRSSSKRRRQAKSYRLGALLLAISLGVVVSVTIFYQHLIKSRVQIDEDTLCPVDGPDEITAILVDSTDPFNGVQRDFLVKYFEEIESGLPKGSLVQIYSASLYSESSFEPSANLCNPGDGKDVSEWSGNPNRVRKFWDSSFRQPLRDAIKSSIEDSSADTSPIMSMIKAVSYKAFPVTSSGQKKSLYIVSDMLEHTDQYSQYSGTLDFDSVSKQPSFAHVAPNLTDVDIYILYISRPGFEHIQTRRHAEFWSSYFGYFNASLHLIKRI